MSLRKTKEMPGREGVAHVVGVICFVFNQYEVCFNLHHCCFHTARVGGAASCRIVCHLLGKFCTH